MENNNYSQETQPQAQPVQYQQPVQQPVYTQYPQQYSVPQALPVVDPEAKEKIKKGNILCFISLACYVAPSIIGGILNSVTDSFENLQQGLTGSSYSLSSLVSSSVMTAAYIAAWVLVIIARTKYKNTFSKVLLWIYIGTLVLGIIALVVVIAFCLFACGKYMN